MDTKNSRNISYVVFISLLFDLLAFTMILPLFPSLMDYYKNNDSEGLYQWIERHVGVFQNLVGIPDRFNGVLFGGVLGSLFSFLQFASSPILGGISDVYGRKPVLILCLIGILFSYIIWSRATTFSLFIWARVIGGLSKGNVSLSMAIVTDVYSKEKRGRGMAMIGIAFSIGFVLGPMIGAAYAKWSHSQEGAWFVQPALLAVALTVINIIFVIFTFKETLPKNNRAGSVVSKLSEAFTYINIVDLFKFKLLNGLIPSHEIEKLCTLGNIYFIYLFLYSGLEFTLTFLTHNKFGYSSMQQGWMFFGIGITMALLQGGWVRKIPPSQTAKTATMGLLLIVPSFLCIGISNSSSLFIFGLILFAFSTSIVVPCMTTLASHYGSDAHKGKAMGTFRSLGALARAIGPVIASLSYWSIGPEITYCVGGILLLHPWFTLRKTLKTKPS
ncbi:major facilitator superfamily domain-containing protein 10 [Daktulosphaira vitifoliae]|uniref:major facilitator superfamily domain-containing protein 10 n=1 Tax=Daktulosphaira vitifoliae TaxID=58002 RepID=UPI0021AA8CE1|nr:major facilitator superfamily domain-containing protein 10 [Daktulosphaira vitifoliae]